MSFLSKILDKLEPLIDFLNQPYERMANEICRYEGPCENKKSLPRSIPLSDYGIYSSSEFGPSSNIVYLDVCMKGLGKSCTGPEKETDVNIHLEPEQMLF